MSLIPFHPAVSAWFARAFLEPTPVQCEAWKSIKCRRNVLVSAPTGSGKTLAAFMAIIDELVREGLEGKLTEETRVVYVSPLKALSNDITRNLAFPLSGIQQSLREHGLPEVDIRVLLRTGDTPQSERERMRRHPPHIVVTTPESLYILLGSASGRAALSTTRTVIVDEIHAVASNKRGSHLALSLERLSALCKNQLVRVGLSATQKPIADVAQFLVGVKGSEPQECDIIDAGHQRPCDLGIEVPSSPLEAVMSGEVWEQVYDRLAHLVVTHRTTLVFVNTRRMAERVSSHLSRRVGDTHVGAHHGSLAKEQRLAAEQRLKTGQLQVLVATASLELGIDIGEIDLVCQLGSPRSIASLLQRVGRAGHSINRVSKGRLFPLSRDELVECVALLDSVRRGEMDRLLIMEQPLDVLAQQIAAEVAAQEWQERGLYECFRRAWPYRALSREDFGAVVRMLAEGFTSRRGRRGALIHYDAINGVLRSRRGARLTALTAGGTIPDTGDYQVLLEPENQVIGTINEDFAVESVAGDIFQLGNNSYRILRTERGTVRVEHAPGMPPTLPFWLGEAPSRTHELSVAVSRLRTEQATSLGEDPSGESCLSSLAKLGVGEAAARQLVDYLGAALAALGCLPTQDTLVFERFFDEAGGMQLVIHSPFGSRINRAWGLALRKRFCRKFNFELQAAATEDNIVLSLTTAHSFQLSDVCRYLHSASVKDLLIQALLDAPMFITRWRWVGGIALALPRFRGGRKVAPQLARMEAEDLIAAVFPDQLACQENLVGEREIPDHPLVRQTISDCLHEAMDIAGLEALLRRLEAHSIAVVCCDLTEPSPLAAEILSARPYAYLDDAPLEERRTQAVVARRWLSPRNAAELGRLDPNAITRVRQEAWPDAQDADELHAALLWLGCVSEQEARSQPNWQEWLDRLRSEHRVVRLAAASTVLFIAAERLAQFKAVWPQSAFDAQMVTREAYEARCWSKEEALVEIVRGRLEGQGPLTAEMLAATLQLSQGEIEQALCALETEGFAMRGRFTPEIGLEEWCERRLLARIHGYTLQRLRAEIEPVTARDFIRFLLVWQRAASDARLEGAEALPAIVAQLEGFEAPAGAWESELLPARVADYDPTWLDDESRSGRIAWARLRPLNERLAGGEHRAGSVRTTPIVLCPRRTAPLWGIFPVSAIPVGVGREAEAVLDSIRQGGPSFFDALTDATGLLRAQVETALAELVACGLVTSDSFGGLRALLIPPERRKPSSWGRRRRSPVLGLDDAGRWALPPRMAPRERRTEALEHVALTLLRRYGVVFWRLLEREASWLPPWRELLSVYRRLESRGTIRGGRFVAGFSGEQYALPDAIGVLRKLRRLGPSGSLISVSAADPLNLLGILTPGARLPALTGNRLLYRDGVPIATFSAGEVRVLEQRDEAIDWRAYNTLLRSPVPLALAASG